MVNVPQAGIDFSSPDKAAVFKIYSVILITTAIALAASFLFSQGTIFFGVLALLAFLTFFALQVILLAAADNYLRVAVISNSLAWASFFYQAVSFYFVLAFAFLVVFLLLGARSGKGELEDSLKIKVSRVVRAVAGLSLTAVVIFTFISTILATKTTLTQEKVNQLTDVFISPIARHYVKDFSPDMKTGDFFAKLAERNFAANRAAVNQSVTQFKNNIEGYVGTEIDLRKSVADNIYQALQFRISTLTPQAKTYWALIILGAIFLSIKSIEFLIALPLTLLVFILYQILLIFNFASVTLKDKSQEVVILK